MWLDVNTNFLRDQNTWLAALIRLWISRSCPPFPCVMLPRYLKWPWISTQLGPTWIPGGAAVVTADAG